MRSKALWGKFAVACFASVAVVAGCKTTNAEGTGASSGSMTGAGGMADGGTDGGMAGGMAQAGGTMGGMADAGASMGQDVKQSASNAASDLKQGASSAAADAKMAAQTAAQGIADAGAAAAGVVREKVSGAATTAADAARGALGKGDAGMDSDAGAAGSAGITDPQIAAIAVAANQVDIAAGKLAKTTSKNAKVKAFASDMIRDHGSANKQAAALVTKLGVTPEESDTSRALTQGGEENIAKLKTLKGKAFDRAYAEHEVAYHQQVLEALDKTLIPGAKDAELKSLLESVRGVVAQHLDHAKMISDALSK